LGSDVLVIWSVECPKIGIINQSDKPLCNYVFIFVHGVGTSAGEESSAKPVNGQNDQAKLVRDVEV
jgi:hypothetical protein